MPTMPTCAEFAPRPDHQTNDWPHDSDRFSFGEKTWGSSGTEREFLRLGAPPDVAAKIGQVIESVSYQLIWSMEHDPKVRFRLSNRLLDYAQNFDGPGEDRAWERVNACRAWLDIGSA